MLIGATAVVHCSLSSFQRNPSVALLHSRLVKPLQPTMVPLPAVHSVNMVRRGFGGSWLCHWLSILRIPLFAAVWLSRCRFTSDFSGCAIINCGKQAWQCHDEFEFLC